jgi:hypothetical protein
VALLGLTAAMPAMPAEARDGAHDFDFNNGVWKTHITWVQDPLSGGTHSIELNGTVTVRKVWDGKAWLEEIDTTGPKGPWGGLTLFTYNPSAHQWNQTFVGRNDGTPTPPLIGSFKDGIGELYSQEAADGHTVLVRGVWSDIKANSHHFEESYSEDGGKSWKPVLSASLTRLQP